MYIRYQMSDREMWAVTLSAPYYPKMNSSMELASGLHRFPITRCRVRARMMREFGSVGPKLVREGAHIIAYEVAGKILRDGIAARYEDLRIRVLTAPGGTDSFMKSIADPKKRGQAALVANTCYLLPPAGILAWNIARAIYYERCSLLLGKEKPHTAMLHIMEVAKYAQRVYNSWEEYFTAFAVGEQFASGNPEPELSPRRAEELAGLMISEKSAARYFPWDLKL